ncbi:sensor histidine kinase [Algoriphagus hitonicola]|uniref:histidine kinase n=1 Tax=Algoriphagus hitonicola TaxID=435880 RepID=A0A1I2TR07_9BACT|nr:histidine kinase N-terminal 7TM domain-containing protein [Algoriphagus hitonicola]SFG67330.1 Signal transduction histidine kinase [Algoriphagus hitonicola]
MELEINFLSAVLIFTSLLVVGISTFLSIKLNEATRWIALTMFFASVWSLFYGLELASKTLEDMLFWIKLEYLGISFTPAVWIIFTLRYTGFRDWNSKWVILLTFCIPVITYLLVLTNDFHHLHYAKTWLEDSGPFPFLGIEIGPWYLIHTIYSYLAFAIGTLILWKRFQFSDPLFKTQTQLIIAAGLFPLFFNLMYQLEIIKPYEGIDLTPFAFLFTYLLLGFAILQYNLFSIKPIAHTKIMENITRGVIVFNSKNKIIEYNPASKKFCANPSKIKMGAHVSEIFEENQKILALLESFEKQTITTEYQKSGEIFNIKIESIPILDRKSILGGTILIFDDITQEMKINQQLREQADDLRQLNDLKDKFFSIISHDLKGPVFGVKELIGMTENGMISKEEFIEMLPEVSRNMEQVSILLENLLAWASSQIRGEYVEPQEFQVLPLLENQKKLLGRIAEENKIKIEIDSAEDLRIIADRNMMDLVIRNLVSNAVKFSDPGGIIKISANSGKDQTVRIEIRDFGAGISQENLIKLRDGISFTTRGLHNESGTGLGLILVRDYLKKNKGHLEVESEEGSGTAFTVVLPSA